MTSAAEERASIVAWLRREAVAERALANAHLPVRLRGKIPERIRMKALGYEEAADAIEAGAHVVAPQEGK